MQDIIPKTSLNLYNFGDRLIQKFQKPPPQTANSLSISGHPQPKESRNSPKRTRSWLKLAWPVAEISSCKKHPNCLKSYSSSGPQIDSGTVSNTFSTWGPPNVYLFGDHSKSIVESRQFGGSLHDAARNTSTRLPPRGARRGAA